MSASAIRKDLRFTDGNVSFKTIDSVEEKPESWYVQVTMPGAGFMRGVGPKIIQMSEERILELVDKQLGKRAQGEMRTIGTRIGERASRKDSTGQRHSWRYNLRQHMPPTAIGGTF